MFNTFKFKMFKQLRAFLMLPLMQGNGRDALLISIDTMLWCTCH